MSIFDAESILHDSSLNTFAELFVVFISMAYIPHSQLFHLYFMNFWLITEFACAVVSIDLQIIKIFNRHLTFMFYFYAHSFEMNVKTRNVKLWLELSLVFTFSLAQVLLIVPISDIHSQFSSTDYIIVLWFWGIVNWSHQI